MVPPKTASSMKARVYSTHSTSPRRSGGTGVPWTSNTQAGRGLMTSAATFAPVVGPSWSVPVVVPS